MAGPAASARIDPAAINVLFISIPPFFPLGDDIADRIALAYAQPRLDARHAVRKRRRRFRQLLEAIERISGELVRLHAGRGASAAPAGPRAR
jgi:hypothetical protein